jgi:hypothetical protein
VAQICLPEDNVPRTFSSFSAVLRKNTRASPTLVLVNDGKDWFPSQQTHNNECVLVPLHAVIAGPSRSASISGHWPASNAAFAAFVVDKLNVACAVSLQPRKPVVLNPV